MPQKGTRFPRPIALGMLLALLLVSGSACRQQETGPGNPSTQATGHEIADSSAAPTLADDGPRGELIEESWEAMYMQGAKVGFGYTERRRDDSTGEPLIHSHARQVLKFKRSGQTTEQSISYGTVETEDGKVISLLAEATGGMLMQSSGKLSGGMLTLVTTTQGKRVTDSIPFDDGVLGYFGVEDSLRRQPMRPGETRRVKWLQPLIHMLTDEYLEALNEEEVDLLGEKKRLLKIKSIARFEGQTQNAVYWADDEGRLWHTARPELAQEVFRTTRERAEAESEKEFDLVLSTTVKLHEPLETPHQKRRIVYRATLKHGNPAEAFINYCGQLVREIDQHTAEIAVLRVTNKFPPQVENVGAEPTAADRASNNFIQSDDPTVRELAFAVATNERDPATIAVNLERYVHVSVTEKNFSQAFATAADVAKTLEGDCTEHAVLLAALLRAREIPARVAGGLVYVEQQQGFGYHMWTEAWIGDRWLPLDATLGQGYVGPGHVKLFDSPLDGAGSLVALLPVMNVLGQLELEVVEVE
jgi:transglutaminase-like putative cysteine protease